MSEPTTPKPGGKPAWRAYRSRHRHDQDSAAHAEDFVPTPSVDHPLVPDDKPILITDADAFHGLIDTLRAAGSFGYDTEFIGENTYYPHLCLIQAGTADTLALIDPFAVGDLTAWWELLADASVEKLVHAGEQDLEPVQRILGRPAANVFDSQIAAGFAGLPYPLSLVKLVDAILDAQLDAGAKFSKWDRRPLTEQQKHYAANDVRYLPAIREALRVRLADTGNTDWARHACDELCAPERFTPDPLKRKIKAKGVNQLTPKKRSVLNALIYWREETAKADNLPPRAMIPDEAMVQLATTLPAGPEQLRAIKFLPRPVREQYEAQMLRCIREGLAGPHKPRPKAARYDREKHRAIVNAMWDRVAEHCQASGIDPAVMTSKRELGRLVAARMEGQSTPNLPCTTGWRAQLLGDTTAPQA
ncbi:MAG: HRDC domain-containing protein [Planctomycetota bacterium]